MKTITERLKALIDHTLLPERKFKALEELTNISSGTWRTWWNRDSKPSGEMIEAVAKNWPECAFWLVTGITDPEHGHISPESLALQRHLKQGIPQREQAAHLFKVLIEMSAYADEREVPAELKEKENYLRKLREAEEQLLAKVGQQRKQH
jgi:hypothetical protein